MDEEKYIIDIKHIGKKFGNLTVLKDISSKIKKNEVVAFRFGKKHFFTMP